MTATIPPLARQVAHGLYAQAELADAGRMMSLIAQWDALTYTEKLDESDKGTASRFSQVPGFELRWCAECHSDVLLDYRDDPEGACMVCEAVQAGPDRWAA